MSDHSWYPIDLASIEPQPARRPTTLELMYPGARHLLSGEPESGKGLVGVALATVELRAGRAVAWIDLESDPEFLAERLQCFGVAGNELREFLYFRPVDPVGKRGVAETIATVVAERQPSLVVFDAFAGLCNLHDLDANKSGDVERAYKAVVEPWRVSGAASLVIDHVVKARGDRGRFAAGSERKLGAVDVHFGLEAVEPFGRGRRGRAKLAIHKDRFGFLQRPRFGDFVLESDETGLVVSWGIEAPTAEGEAWKPTALMAKVSAYLERQREPVSRSTIARDVTGKRDYLLAAIDHLIEDGFASESPGARGARLVASVKPYDDPSPLSGKAGEGSSGPSQTTLPPSPGVGTGDGNGSEAEVERLELLAEEMGLA